MTAIVFSFMIQKNEKRSGSVATGWSNLHDVTPGD